MDEKVNLKILQEVCSIKLREVRELFCGELSYFNSRVVLNAGSQADKELVAA